MTDVCYSLEEAARKLGISETVLVRLSQYVKIPQAAYEEEGFLAFKEEIAFTDKELQFFRTVRGKLLEGQSLESVRQRLLGQALDIPGMVSAGGMSGEVAKDAETASLGPNEAPARQPPEEDRQPSPPAAPMVEMMDSAPYRKAARRTFRRYKQLNRQSAPQEEVFRKLLKELSTEEESPPGPDRLPTFKPLKDKTEEAPDRAAPRQAAEKSNMSPAPRDGGGEPAPEPPAQEFSWEWMVSGAAHNRFRLDSHLRKAALYLKEQAISNNRKNILPPDQIRG